MNALLLIATIAWLAHAQLFDDGPLTASEHANLMQFWTDAGCPASLCERPPLGSLCSVYRNRTNGYVQCLQGRLKTLSLSSALDQPLNGSISSVVGTFDKLNTLTFTASWTTMQTVPSEIGRLTNLTLVEFSRVSRIPNQIGQLSRLTQLYVTNAPLAAVPPGLANLKQPVTVTLRNLNLTGSLPDLSNATNMSIDVGGNNLTGAVRLGPNASCNLVGLWNGYRYALEGERNCFTSCTGSPCCSSVPYLCPSKNESVPLTSAEHTRLTRVLDELGCHAPACLRGAAGQACSGFNGASSKVTCTFGSVTGVQIGAGAVLNGTLPTALGALTGLTSLELLSTTYRGTMVSQIGKLTLLSSLSLAGVDGGIASEIAYLSLLTSLVLTPTNPVRTPFPKALGGTQTQTVWLASNNLYGDLPTAHITWLCLFGMKNFSVANNSLTGDFVETEYPVNAPPRTASCELVSRAHPESERNCFQSCQPANSRCCTGVNLCPSRSANGTTTVTVTTAATASSTTPKPSGTPTLPTFSLNLTGNVAQDFGAVRSIRRDDPKDVPLGPGAWPSGAVSGWDIQSFWAFYDVVQDNLFLGIDCYGICGDADGDGDAGRTSAVLAGNNGVDRADLASGEGIGIFMSFDYAVADWLPSFVSNLTVPWNVVLGVPGGQPRSGPPLPCTANNATLNSTNCFGLYTYDNTNVVPMLRRFQAPFVGTAGSWAVFNANPTPGAGNPDIEYVITKASALQGEFGAAAPPFAPWAVLVQVVTGSSDDGGIGDDVFPSATDYTEVLIQCRLYDACDICLGDGSTCQDCAGVPNGPAVYDACGECGGSSKDANACTARTSTTSVTTTLTTATSTTATTILTASTTTTAADSTTVGTAVSDSAESSTSEVTSSSTVSASDSEASTTGDVNVSVDMNNDVDNTASSVVASSSILLATWVVQMMLAGWKLFEK